MSLGQISKNQIDVSRVAGDQPPECDVLDVHAVLLVNYVRPHHVVSYQALAKRVRKLTVLLSVAMEPDRAWEAEWSELDVRVQKNWMFTSKWKHSTGFSEDNFIHLPIDTTKQLKSLDPDIVFSYEMGIRTLLSSWFRRFNPRVPLVLVGNMSDHIEKERGALRRGLRWMIRRGVDYFTYNGPSCKRYFRSLAISEDRLFHLPYCIDPGKVFTGQRSIESASRESVRRLLYCGALSSRKGIHKFTQCLREYCDSHPEQIVELSIAGSGPQQHEIKNCATSNLAIKFLGNCDRQELRAAYGATDICVLPTLADEWGLVPIEALASGVPVLGSVFAQSVEAVVEEAKNGWAFDPTDVQTMQSAIDRAMKCSSAKLAEMGAYGKQSVAHISGEATAEKFCDIIEEVLPEIKTLDGQKTQEHPQ